MDKPKSIPSSKAAKGAAVTQTVSKAKVLRIEKNPADLDELLTRFRKFKHDVMQLLLKREYQRAQHEQRQNMLVNVQVPGDDVVDDLNQNTERGVEIDEDKLDDEFKSLLEEMETYLQPVSEQLQHLFRPSTAAPASAAGGVPNPNTKRGAGGAAAVDKETQREYVVLLADPALLELPLEALSVLQRNEALCSVTRDVSLQSLFHKVHQQVTDDAAEKGKKDKEREKVKPASRIPGSKEATKKTTKIVPLDRPVPPTCLPVDTNNFKFIVDPHLECSKNDKNSPVACFNRLLEEHEQQFTARWVGLMGSEHIPSVGEFEIYINESSGFIFYGPERFLSHLPAFKAATLNLAESCQLLMLFDRSQTTKSVLRQAKLDVLKSSESLGLENPVDTALLLGLTGVRSLCLNQWHCSLDENAQKVDLVMKDLLPGGQTVGQMIKMLFSPHRRTRSKESGETEQQQTEVTKDQTTEDTNQGEETSEVNKSWFNMVCYGAPNLLVTQLTKT